MSQQNNRIMNLKCSTCMKLYTIIHEQAQKIRDQKEWTDALEERINSWRLITEDLKEQLRLQHSEDPHNE